MIENEEKAQEMLKILSDYYKCPVMPITIYCDTLSKWKHLLLENGMKRQEENEKDTILLDLYSQVSSAFMAITKSNLLSRLLYEGEELRTKKCPVHQGQWSGCRWEVQECATIFYPQGCMSGSNITGWLPEQKDRLKQIESNKDKLKCKFCGIVKEYILHNMAWKDSKFVKIEGIFHEFDG